MWAHKILLCLCQQHCYRFFVYVFFSLFSHRYLLLCCFFLFLPCWLSNFSCFLFLILVLTSDFYVTLSSIYFLFLWCAHCLFCACAIAIFQRQLAIFLLLGWSKVVKKKQASKNSWWKENISSRKNGKGNAGISICFYSNFIQTPNPQGLIL